MPKKAGSKARPKAGAHRKLATVAMGVTKASPVSKVAALAAGARHIAGVAGHRAGGRRRHKKSALWYAKEIQRLKLKRRYEKVRLGVASR